MKSIPRLFVLCCLCLLLVNQSISQPPAAFNYQAVLRDTQGQLIVSENVTIDIVLIRDSIDGQEVFHETHHALTSPQGMVSLAVGSLNSMEDFLWGQHIYYIRSVVNGVETGTSRLLSVPYALHARTSAGAFSGDYEDLTGTPDLSGFISVADPVQGGILFYGENGWQTLPPGEEGQVLNMQNGLPHWVDPPSENDYTEGVYDIDGNFYPLITLGAHVWMARNLRTSKFADGTPIETGLSGSEWQNNTSGAFAVHPHENIDGIGSEEQMLDSYGALYNWYAVDNPAGLCPAGWRIPTDEEWTQMSNYLVSQYDEVTTDNAANALKSCRQQNSPLGGDCDTQLHPRWNAHDVHYGNDLVGFAGLPGGHRGTGGSYALMGFVGYWWTATPHSAQTVYYRDFDYAYGSILRASTNRERGFSIRCIRNTRAE